MNTQKTIEQALTNLIQKEETEIVVGESRVTMRIFDHSSKIIFSTNVYRGENYIPSSVRKCLSEVVPELPLQTYLTIEEASFSVFLHFIGETSGLSSFVLKELLEEFASAADVWRDLLDEHDQRDLVFVRAN